MSIQAIAARARRLLPGPVFSIVRRIGIALLTPLHFSWKTGHLRSSLKAKAVNRRGQPILWYTYPAVDFLESKDFSARSILEFGAGHSTLWWGQRAKEVVSFEDNERWYESLSRKIDGNTTLILTSRENPEIEAHIGSRKFDLIIIDGLYRPRCAQESVGRVAAGGAIILDNSDAATLGPHITAATLDLFFSKGFSRIDFYGYAAGVLQPHCTSLFFKDDCFLLRTREHPWDRSRACR